MNKINGFISHRCNDYHKDWNRNVFEAFITANDIIPVYGCSLEPGLNGILSKNITNGLSKAQIFFAFITHSWNERYNPSWPKKEWALWQQIKKDTFSYDCCFGFYLQPPSYPGRKRTSLKLPSYISDLMSYSVSEEKDEKHNILLAKSDKYELFINSSDKKTITKKISEYRKYYNLLKTNKIAEQIAPHPLDLLPKKRRQI